MKNNISQMSDKQLKELNFLLDIKDQNKTFKSLYFSTLIKTMIISIVYNYRYNKSSIFIKYSKYAIVLITIIGIIFYYTNNPRIVTLPGIKSKKEIVYIDNSNKGNKEFLYDLGQFESRGNYNPSGNENYWGKYQIGRMALDAIGFDKITKEEFIKDTLLQEVSIRRLMTLNKKSLSAHIGKWEGKTLNNIYITQSGLLAAAHLGGCQNVIRFLESNGSNVFCDGNGTPITKYMKHFSGYKLKF